MRAYQRRNNDQRPIKQQQKKERADDAADEKCESEGRLMLHNERCDDGNGEPATRDKPDNSDRNLLQKKREQRADKSENKCGGDDENGRWFVNEPRRQLNAGGKADSRDQAAKTTGVQRAGQRCRCRH